MCTLNRCELRRFKYDGTRGYGKYHIRPRLECGKMRFYSVHFGHGSVVEFPGEQPGRPHRTTQGICTCRAVILIRCVSRGSFWTLSKIERKERRYNWKNDFVEVKNLSLMPRRLL